MDKKKIIYFLLLGIFLVIFLVAAYNIIVTLVDYQAGEETYNGLQQLVEIPSTTPTTEPAPTASTVPAASDAPTEPTEPEPEPINYPAVDFNALHEINANVVAWIYIEGTNINYPVVLGTDNQYYVTHMIDGKYNRAGSIFMDYRNQADFLDKHTILYGHNMKNNTMFADVTNYRDQEYYDAHPRGLIMTPDGNFYFEIVAAHVASLSSDAWELNFESDADSLRWAQAAMEKSDFVSSYTPVESDVYLTLSTCSYEFSNARFVLLGVLKSE